MTHKEEDEAMERLVQAYRAQREDGDPTRTEYGIMVIITVPSTMKPEDVKRDLLSSIEFGSPLVTILYDVPAPRQEDVVKTIGTRL